MGVCECAYLHARMSSSRSWPALAEMSWHRCASTTKPSSRSACRRVMPASRCSTSAASASIFACCSSSVAPAARNSWSCTSHRRCSCAMLDGGTRSSWSLLSVRLLSSHASGLRDAACHARLTRRQARTSYVSMHPSTSDNETLSSHRRAAKLNMLLLVPNTQASADVAGAQRRSTRFAKLNSQSMLAAHSPTIACKTDGGEIRNPKFKIQHSKFNQVALYCFNCRTRRRLRHIIACHAVASSR